MTDPRENKLPKWAQEIIENLRVEVALRYPDEPAPEPDFDVSEGFAVKGAHISNAENSIVYSHNGSTVFKHYVGAYGYLYRSEDKVGFGSRAHGEYYLNIDDARLSLRWRIARKAARDLLAARTAEPRS